MGRAIEDILCGILGYGIGNYRGKKNCELTQEQVESLIHSFLSQVPLDGVIDCWLDANKCDTFSKKLDAAYTLKQKADDVFKD